MVLVSLHKKIMRLYKSVDIGASQMDTSLAKSS
jgi:hypothetical protein